MTDGRGVSFYSISGYEGKNAIEASIHTLEVDGDTLILDTGFHVNWA